MRESVDRLGPKRVQGVAFGMCDGNAQHEGPPLLDRAHATHNLGRRQEVQGTDLIVGAPATQFVGAFRRSSTKSISELLSMACSISPGYPTRSTRPHSRRGGWKIRSATATAAPVAFTATETAPERKPSPPWEPSPHAVQPIPPASPVLCRTGRIDERAFVQSLAAACIICPALSSKHAAASAPRRHRETIHCGAQSSSEPWRATVSRKPCPGRTPRDPAARAKPYSFTPRGRATQSAQVLAALHSAFAEQRRS